ncbi:pyridoxal 5'-phosphate synthase glutaminase subunit PdxT [Prevotella sp. A2931]|uniref:Pyridoxal 5'-phosphate synthase subunit PdxT n=1 Tax=Prevotella illustrans TaxID=2800387 RepID=A0ABS3M2P2_9BACT|nr:MULTISPECIES: pyridoxal 5'-phosphate synthase glutaminase subunit PdxT [Prevotella]MBO1362412.1 pyridoxal 5'-phosphate synthase glutaminase subunit PdxT [Prevotella illustrans]PTL25541.1 pyridoxal 5'-phosphate synthase glutaminase subunit PdxT [Prevotella sp. oral taxon 820]
MRIAILALQGAFAEHRQMLSRIGIDSFFVRNAADWQQTKDGLIIPGGESTAMMRIISDEGLSQPIREAITHGLPTFGTCAGLIMLDRVHLNTMNILAKRNAYGRQLGSFRTIAEFKEIGRVPMTFIRAPFVAETDTDVEILAEVDGRIVAARQGKQLVTAFHPELDEDERIHRLFIDMCRAFKYESNHASTS